MAYLETDRLILREWAERDLPALAAMNADPDVMRFFPSTLTESQSREQFERCRLKQAENGFHFQPIEDKNTGRFAGFVGIGWVPANLHFAPAVEIGWRLPVDYWGKGYATEAAAAWLDYGFDTIGLDEIVSFAVEANHPSRAVMARIGMTQDANGVFRHPNIDPGHPLAPHVLYRLRRANYESFRAAPG